MEISDSPEVLEKIKALYEDPDSVPESDISGIVEASQGICRVKTFGSYPPSLEVILPGETEMGSSMGCKIAYEGKARSVYGTSWFQYVELLVPGSAEFVWKPITSNKLPFGQVRGGSWKGKTT